MATIESLQRDISALNTRLDNLIGDSKDLRGLPLSTTFGSDTLIAIQNPGEGITGVERAVFISAVLGGIRRISDDPAINEVTGINQFVLGRKTGINNGELFAGVVIFYPPTQDSHIDELYWKF